MGAPDAYESKFMGADGGSILREKTIWKLHWLLLVGPIAMFASSIAGFAGVGTKPMPIAIAIALVPIGLAMLALWATFIALRVHVTTREVVIQYGVFGPRIPIEGIESAVVKDVPELKFGGGVKWVDGAWAYTLWGQGTRVVRIEWRDAKGKKKATIVSSPDPDRLAAAIEKARSGDSTKLRVGAEADALEDAEADARARNAS